MKYGHRKLNMSKVTRALGHTLITGAALHATINNSEFGIIKSFLSRFLLLLILQDSQPGSQGHTRGS